MPRLCPPEVFLAGRTVRVGVSLGGPKVFVGCQVSERELVRISVLHDPLLGFGVRGFLRLDLLAGIVDFSDVASINGYEIYRMGSVVTHDCGVNCVSLLCGLGEVQDKRDGAVVIEDGKSLSVPVSYIITTCDATQLDLYGNETAWLHKPP